VIALAAEAFERRRNPGRRQRKRRKLRRRKPIWWEIGHDIYRAR